MFSQLTVVDSVIVLNMAMIFCACMSVGSEASAVDNSAKGDATVSSINSANQRATLLELERTLNSPTLSCEPMAVMRVTPFTPSQN
mgnify:CR=1 FL=1